ncbi:MAG: CIA30 family protein [Prochlorococcaceae cyanobacterium]|jgi:hypothetical protein
MGSQQQASASRVLFRGDGFAGWHALNDPIMGGRSSGSVTINSAEGLVFDGEVVEQGGGFISVRSPLLSPPLDLSDAEGLVLTIAGEGRRFKLAVATSDGVGGLTNLIPGGLRWVTEFATNDEGDTTVEVLFSDLIASVRAQPIQSMPLGYAPRFDRARMTRLQVLHSKFDDKGGLNKGFRSGAIHVVIKEICAMGHRHG